MEKEIIEHLKNKIIPFLLVMSDNENCGYYGLLDNNLVLHKKAIKGVILHSRILWFYSKAYLMLQDMRLLDEARHVFEFLSKYCYDHDNGGVYWSVNYDGSEDDSIKHTYNQAFAIYAFTAYYEASGDEKAIRLAMELYDLIESKCRDEGGYLEAFNKHFQTVRNYKLSENGILATRTMNTLLHVFEAYTELYRVLKKPEIRDKLCGIIDIFLTKVYNPDRKRLDVFFDADMNSILDIHSYGHDIEASWLLDYGCDVLGDENYTARVRIMTDALAENIYQTAYHNNSLWYERARGKEDKTRSWWVQSEAIIGFMHAYEKHPEETKYLEAANNIWEYIKGHIVDKRPGSEWLSEMDDNNVCTYKNRGIVEKWKGPYHNGRMCMIIGKNDCSIFD